MLKYLPLVLLLAAAPAGAEEKIGAKAVLVDAKGTKVGSATFTEGENGEGVIVMVKVEHLPAGKHGIHVHEKGSCDAPSFQSAGKHFNPLDRQHGMHNEEGMHAGDMPNLEVGTDGEGEIEFTNDMVTLGNDKLSLLKPGGTALVIHAEEDDEMTDPSGNSGDRIACGVIYRVSESTK